jgi:hypothetical protein
VSAAGLAAGQSATALARFTAPLPAGGAAAEVLAGLPQPLSPPHPAAPDATDPVWADVLDPSPWLIDRP